MFHLGDLGWQQNLLAVEWFLQHVWPLVHKQVPQLRFSIAGRNIPQTINAHNVPNVDVIGDVPSAAQFMLANNIMVVPLFAGGGIRIKIIEGMAAGNCIVTTPLGAQGLGVTHKQQLLIAQTPQEFAEAIVHYANNPESARHITENARKFTQDNFETNTIAKAYTEFYRYIASMPPR
ncbi:MAG: glycosyltransferase [Candidatus Kapabacteria bacterium]|nr:glycosyltransferase [Candidatus Kapabacteria bacterium]